MGILLRDEDEFVHPIGPEPNWNESRYFNFWDPVRQVGGWFRIGNRPNEGHAEVSACINLPDGRTAFMFERVKIKDNGLNVGGQRWTIVTPWYRTEVQYQREMILLESPWQLSDPKTAFATSPKVEAEVSLVCHSQGLESTMGFDQDHLGMIWLPGQADFHYQNLTRVTGTIRVGDQTWTVDGRGGKDHSWGPRNWHAKIYFRWLIANADDDHGFMLVRAVGPTKQTRSGFVWHQRQFHLVDTFTMENQYAGPPNYQLLKTRAVIKSGSQEWVARGMAKSWLPARHKQKNEKGELALLRICKSPMEWVLDDTRPASGMCEYHDLIVDGRPIGLSE